MLPPLHSPLHIYFTLLRNDCESDFATVLSKTTHGLSTQRMYCTTVRTGAVSQHPCNKPGILRISNCSQMGVRRRRMTRPCWLPTLLRKLKPKFRERSCLWTTGKGDEEGHITLSFGLCIYGQVFYLHTHAHTYSHRHVHHTCEYPTHTEKKIKQIRVRGDNACLGIYFSNANYLRYDW